jgi:hypothetical protein
MIWEAYQQTKIAGAKSTADRAMSKAGRHANRTEDVELHVERLSLACQAMWELIRDTSELNETDLETKILEIDGRDGRVDGKMTTKPIDCPTCARPTNSSRDACMICGAPITRQHQFEG